MANFWEKKIDFCCIFYCGCEQSKIYSVWFRCLGQINGKNEHTTYWNGKNEAIKCSFFTHIKLDIIVNIQVRYNSWINKPELREELQLKVFILQYFM